jgi:endoglucanase
MKRSSLAAGARRVPFLEVKGMRFVHDGQPVRLMGFGLGNHLSLDHVLLGLPGVESQVRAAFARVFGEQTAGSFWARFLTRSFGPADAVRLRSLGVNSLRVPINARHFLGGPGFASDPEVVMQELERLLALCGRNGIWVILDLHAAPGGQNPDWHSDNPTGSALFWERPELQERVVEVWGMLAERFRDHPWIGGYDLLNEPASHLEPDASAEALNAFHRRAHAAIRAHDERHVVFLEGDAYATDTTRLRPIVDPQTAYSFHYYPYRDFERFVGLDAGALENALRGDLLAGRALRDARERLHRPVWCGETGVPAKGPDRPGMERLLDATLAVLNDLDVSWSVRTYKDCGWMGAFQTRADGAWGRFCTEVAPGWEAPPAFGAMEDGGDGILERLCPGVTCGRVRREAAHRFQAVRHLGLVSRMEERLEAVGRRRLGSFTQGFALGDCAPWGGVIDIVRRRIAG